MGRRKERRLAALSNAGRRVKLDLFAEPSGELGGSTGHDDVGGDIDSKVRDGLPKSQSSSGQQPQNPLLLLGQYSDDELDEGSSKGPSDSKVDIPMLNEEAKGLLNEESTDLGTKATEDLVAHNDGQEGVMQNSTSLDATACNKNESDVAAGDLQKEMVSKDQISGSETFDEQVITDVSSGWKMVMHEESRRYYYWNTETGETSWEVPQVLATTIVSNNGKMQSAAVVVDSSNIPSAMVQDSLAAVTNDGPLGTTAVSHGQGSQMDGWSGEYTNEYLESGHQSSDVNGTELRRNAGLLSAPYGGDYLIDSKPGLEQQQSENDFPSRLVKQSESLLERLKSLEKLKGNLQGQDSLSRYILEIEIRLSDFRSLASYGSSLLPFWVHSDRQIKQLESAINNDMLWTAKSAQDEVEDKHLPLSGGLGGQQKDMGPKAGVEANENKESSLTSEISNDCQVDASAVALKDCNKSPENDDIGEQVPSFTSLDSHLETSVGVNKQVGATIHHDESTQKQGFNVGEDVDMDVDMEVEDVNSAGNTSLVDASVTTCVVQTDQQVQLNPPPNYCSLLPEDEFDVPPPPDDEWIPPPPPDNEQVPPPPPPPPDNEQVPPPPPDDLPEPSYAVLPSYTETGQSLPFSEYNLSYPGASSEYYGHTTTVVPSSNIYGLAEGCQITMPPAQLYYSAVPNTYSESSQVIINPTEPVAYYGLQDGAGSTSLPDINVNISGVVGVADRATGDVPSTSASIQAPAPVSADVAVLLPPTTAVAAAGSADTSSVAKVQTKAVRSRKRAVAVGSSLKSNKKVSSLVDKWKAAKEELLEEEEEPESAFEVLERKRRREIEEWRAKQIASGEAKENANFQPLGGDWRERVKRKRAEAGSGSVDMPLNTVEQNQQPDLVELSKGLPPGWQVYWDESSKQIYYGNTITSKTTWTRPTK